MHFSPTLKVIVQGAMEPLGATAIEFMQACGTQVVAGISSGAQGQMIQGIPVFDMVEQALATAGPIEATVIVSHPYAALDAALEAITAGIRQIVLVSKGIPPLDMVQLIRRAEVADTFLVGPNSPGIIIPNRLMLGVHPPNFYTPGVVGLITRSSTLTYEVAWELTQAGIGQSIGVSIGGDAIAGSTFPQWLQILDEDDATEVIVLVGEIGGNSEEAAAHYIASTIEKPVIAYIAGRTAPSDRRMAHADAIVDFQSAYFGPNIGTAESKIAAFQRANIPVVDRPSQIPNLVKQVLKLPA